MLSVQYSQGDLANVFMRVFVPIVTAPGMIRSLGDSKAQRRMESNNKQDTLVTE